MALDGVVVQELASPVLVCPACETGLVSGEDGVACARCGVSWPVRDGIPSFCGGEQFYDDYLDEHCPFVLNPPRWKAAVLSVLPYWSWREWKFFRHHLRPRGRILDVGCARGKEWFSSRASFIAGVDPSLPSLRECAGHYDLVAQAEITRLPFATGTFDFVTTSHVYGHIPFDDKDDALSEISRVLVNGGRSLNIIETDSLHPFVHLGKEDPDLYVRNFIETDGHVGLELPSQVIQRFERHGLRVVDVRKMEAGKVHLHYYEKYLARGYADRFPSVKHRVARWQRLRSRPLWLGAYEVTMGAYHSLVEQRRAPLDNAMFIALCAVKQKTPLARPSARRRSAALQQSETDVVPDAQRAPRAGMRDEA